MAYLDEIMHVMTALDAPRRVRPVANEDELKWFPDGDFARGMFLRVGYTVGRERGCGPGIWIHRAILNTGQRGIGLALREIDTNRYEALIRAEEDGNELDCHCAVVEVRRAARKQGHAGAPLDPLRRVDAHVAVHCDRRGGLRAGRVRHRFAV